MKKYVIRNLAGELVTIGAEGFIPNDVITEAPVGDYVDSDLVEASPGVIIVDETKKNTRLAAIVTDKALVETKKTKLKALQALKGKSLSNAEIKAVVEGLVELFLTDAGIEFIKSLK